MNQYFVDERSDVVLIRDRKHKDYNENNLKSLDIVLSYKIEKTRQSRRLISKCYDICKTLNSDV